MLQIDSVMMQEQRSSMIGRMARPTVG